MHDVARILNLVIQVEVVLIVIRVIASWLPDLDPYHPVMRLLRAVVDPVLAPFRSVLPTFSGIDLSPLLAILVLQAAGSVFGDYADGIVPNLLVLALLIVRQLVIALFSIMAIIVFVRLVMSFLRPSPWHPLVIAVRDMSRPLVRPFGNVLPHSRSVDTAALAALVAFVAALLVSRYVLDIIITHSY